MNKLDQSWIKKHPALTTAAGILIFTIALKVAHRVPLEGLKEKFLEDLRINTYNLGPISEEFFRLDPRKIHVVAFGEDTLIIQNETKEKTFALTCPLEQEYCLLRENPYSIRITGTVVGFGESISKKSPPSLLSHTFGGYRNVVPTKTENSI